MLLSNEDAAAIPYQMDQKVSFVNQNGDTLAYQVVYDETYPYDADRYYSYESKMQPRQDYFCYARTVILECAETGERLGFTVCPQKELSVYYGNEIDMNGSLLQAADSYTLDGIEYEHVLQQILYSQYTGELIYNWYYNEEFGLIYFKYYDQSLTLLR
jgi:hypothetical protein